jgi:hypothetical protein
VYLFSKPVMCTQVVDLLLAKGADPALKDNEGHTAVDFDYKLPSLEESSGDPVKEVGAPPGKEEL